VPFFSESEAILVRTLRPTNSNTYYLLLIFLCVTGFWPYSAGSEDKQHGNKANSSIDRDHRVADRVCSSTGLLHFWRTGRRLQVFSFRDLSGNVHTLSEYRGKVVVIQFFGADCGYCQSDAKDTLVPLYNTYYKNDAKVQFLGMEIDGSSNSAIQQYVGLTGVPMARRKRGKPPVWRTKSRARRPST